MNGQWVGHYAGAQPGYVRANFDDVGDHYSAAIYLTPQDQTHPTTLLLFRTANKAPSFTLGAPQVEVAVVDPATGAPARRQQASTLYPTLTVPSFEATVSFNDNTKQLQWTTNIGNSAAADLTVTGWMPSALSSTPCTWEEFKGHLNTMQRGRYVFRGQTGQQRVRTTYHRAGRANLIRYMTEDVPRLHKRLTALTRHVFNLGVPDEYGAFLNLVRHHGYPTPLLDWTQSPYVAAFFAYRSVTRAMLASATAASRVRILCFDRTEWERQFSQFQRIEDRAPHLSFIEFIAIDNERTIAQQAVSSVTNIDDIETAIQRLEGAYSRTFLRAFDLSMKERPVVFEELRYMNITAGSLFPGIDGACEEMRERMFPYQP
ncbi:MAG TPA: FRG domain-containing protein [Steroidobacteraceae bacterium]|nr:FRG domain-containing protein [Steroidobacteraceae bacterium]